MTETERLQLKEKKEKSIQKSLGHFDEVLKSVGLDLLIDFGTVKLAVTDEETDNHRFVDFGLKD